MPINESTPSTGNSAEGPRRKLTRRDFIKLLLTGGGTLVLAACGADPNAIEAETSTAQPSPSETSAAATTEAPPTPDQRLEQYNQMISTKGSYVRTMAAKNQAEGSPLAEKVKVFIDKLNASGNAHIDVSTLDKYKSEEEAAAAGAPSYSFSSINPYGIPYVAFYNDPIAQKSGFIFDIWTGESPLMATKEGALGIFTDELSRNAAYAALITEKTGVSANNLNPVDFSITTQTNRLADLVHTPTGVVVMGVNNTNKQWEFIDSIGGLKPTPTAEAPTATTLPENQKPEGVALSDQTIITELVNESKETNTYPSGLTEEQEKAWFEELNRQCGNQMFTYEIPGDSNNILVSVPQHLYPNFEKEVAVARRFEQPKSHDKWVQFGDNSDNFIVPKSFFETEDGKIVAEKLRQEKWVQIKNVKGDNNTTASLYLDPDSKQWIKLITSGDFTEIINASNIEEKIQSKKFTPPISFNKEAVIANNDLVAAFMLPIKDRGLTRIPFQSTVEGANYGLDLLPMLRVFSMANENGQQVQMGQIFYCIAANLDGYEFTKEGDEIKVEAQNGNIFREKKFEKVPNKLINSDTCYHVAISKNPDSAIDGKSQKKLFTELMKAPFTKPKDGYTFTTQPNLKQVEPAVVLTHRGYYTSLIQQKVSI